jgi:hypothetical protein
VPDDILGDPSAGCEESDADEMLGASEEEEEPPPLATSFSMSRIMLPSGSGGSTESCITDGAVAEGAADDMAFSACSV